MLAIRLVDGARPSVDAARPAGAPRRRRRRRHAELVAVARPPAADAGRRGRGAAADGPADRPGRRDPPGPAPRRVPRAGWSCSASATAARRTGGAPERRWPARPQHETSYHCCAAGRCDAGGARARWPKGCWLASYRFRLTDGRRRTPTLPTRTTGSPRSSSSWPTRSGTGGAGAGPDHRRDDPPRPRPDQHALVGEEPAVVRRAGRPATADRPGPDLAGPRTRASWPPRASAASSPSAAARPAARAWSSWTGARPTPRTHVVLVGKGITFDTGGISIKPRDGDEADAQGHGRRRRRRRRHPRRRRAAPAGTDHHAGPARREHGQRLGVPPRRRGPALRRHRPARPPTPTPRGGWCSPTRWRTPSRRAAAGPAGRPGDPDRRQRRRARQAHRRALQRRTTIWPPASSPRSSAAGERGLADAAARRLRRLPAAATSPTSTARPRRVPAR